MTKAYLEEFPREQLLFLDGAEFKSRPWVTTSLVEDFLDIQHELSEERFYFNATKGFHCMETLRCMSDIKGKPIDPVSEEKLKQMSELWSDHNREYYKLVGRDFNW